MINKAELIYKLISVIEFLKEHGGYDYKLYNLSYPNDDAEPDSNIVEYAEDVLEIMECFFEMY